MIRGARLTNGEAPGQVSEFFFGDKRGGAGKCSRLAEQLRGWLDMGRELFRCDVTRGSLTPLVSGLR